MTTSSPISEASQQIIEIARELKSALHQYPNFPKDGILFEDFLPIFRNPDLFNKLIMAFKMHVGQSFPDQTIDYIVGLESRGFLFGPTLALALDAGFVPIRKKGKLPGETYKAEYSKEYGDDYFEIQKDSIPDGANVIIVDDILATGGSAEAAGKLVLECEANLMGFLFVMELDFLRGRDRLQAGSFTLLSGQEEGLKEGQE
ncbi:DEKNAAC102329 [Brettanomyces naardenensis]|uniref:Adenine phosphoribosyltransferase n=1 Tax=Brettanomyces naardenensis TaxID=13370 RepID=A0A448YLA5_BRENA|nr:DEKNAAC102329 [Brettanomyces naardenensis]